MSLEQQQAKDTQSQVNMGKNTITYDMFYSADETTVWSMRGLQYDKMRPRCHGETRRSKQKSF